MRLKDEEIRVIKESVTKLDRNAKVFLFGSRAKDDKRGGDIDLLILSGKLTFGDKIKILRKLYDEIGEQKIDILIAKDLSKPFVKLAYGEGVEL